MLFGASSLALLPHSGKTVPVTFPLTLTDYFQSNARTNATCSISLPNLPQYKVVPSSIRIVGYSTKKHSLTMRYRPSDAFITNLYMPYYFDENTQSLLPGASYFLFPPFAQHTTESEWLGHFRKLISRFDCSFGLIKGFSNHTIDEVAKAFSVAPVHVLADALTEVVTCYPYRADKKESFDDVFFNHGGDCEDFTKGILRAWNELERTMSIGASSTFFASLKPLMQTYRPWAVLGAVKKRSFSSSDKVMGDKRNEAGHMFAMLIPRTLEAVYLSTKDVNDLVQEASGSEGGSVILEGTARVSYLAGALGVGYNNTKTKRTGAPLRYKTAYELQPMRTDVDSLSNFYIRIAYVFTADSKLYRQYGTHGFLVVNETSQRYGVESKYILHHSDERIGPTIRFIADWAYSNRMRSYLETTYKQVQARYQSGIPKLPLHGWINKVLHGRRSNGPRLGVSDTVYFVDTESVRGKEVEFIRQVKALGARMIVKEDTETYRLEFKT